MTTCPTKLSLMHIRPSVKSCVCSEDKESLVTVLGTLQTYMYICKFPCERPQPLLVRHGELISLSAYNINTYLINWYQTYII